MTNLNNKTRGGLGAVLAIGIGVEGHRYVPRSIQFAAACGRWSGTGMPVATPSHRLSGVELRS